ncbi:MAG TPA: formate--tetrahydrofolate ligase, partial [Kofleriaceae bacterium]|nr:formate--tetrahydrofolate ligase [Kofleriaceae bacterium]
LFDVAEKLGVPSAHVIPYGRDLAKLDQEAVAGPGAKKGHLVLVSAITPTPAGEGKTTTSIGLADALAHLGKSVCLALREPSLGPCMGAKGVGTGGGRSQVTPADKINLHFTGDFHAISSAHNMLAAVIDNQIHFRTDLNLDLRRILWPRVMDMNDRSLRQIVLGLGGHSHGMPRQTGFDITAASELMAILCLADDIGDLRARIDRILIGFDRKGNAMHASGLKVTGAAVALLRDAMLPNLVQTLSGTPALIHGGPFANIAHGCNSVIATRTAMSLADWTVTEAGFGFDLGAEKFFDIKCRTAGLDVDVVVLVASVRALKMHGGVALSELERPDPEAVERGLPNLHKHIENEELLKGAPVVALNRRSTDTDEEIAVIRRACEQRGIAMAVCEHYAHGPEGALDLARAVIERSQRGAQRFRPVYALEASIPDKIRAIATKMYGADDLAFTRDAERDLRDIEKLGYGHLPICMAKTPASLSDDPALRGRPRDFQINVPSRYVNSGAGVIVVLTGDIIRMPGLPKRPRAELIDLDRDGQIINLE